MITKEQIYQLKIDALTGELEEYDSNLFEYLIKDPNYFEDGFIEFILNEPENPWNVWNIAIIKQIGVNEFLKSQPRERVENLLLAFIRNNVSVQEIIGDFDESTKDNLNLIIDNLANQGRIKIEKLSEVMRHESFNAYYSENEEKFSENLVEKLLNERKIDNISIRARQIMIERCSYETCLSYFEKGQLDQALLEQKEKIIKENKDTMERNGRIRNVLNKSEYSEDDKKVFIEDLSSGQFYSMVNEDKLNDDIISRRREFDKNIIEHAEQYDEVTVSDAIAGTYFQRGAHDICLDLETIINYSESKELRPDRIDEIKKLYTFLSGNIHFDNESEYGEYIKDLSQFCQSFDNDSIEEMIEDELTLFRDDTNSALEETKDKVFFRENSNTIPGTNIPIYSLDKTSESQQKFLLLVHSEDAEKAKKYYESPGKGMSFSLIDQDHLETFGTGRIIFGYYSLKDGVPVAINTSDGQTNQRNIFSETDQKVMAKELYSISDFMDNTEGYNEIAVNFKGKKPGPDYIVTFEETPTQDEIEAAQTFGIPILYVDKERYVDKNNPGKRRETKNRWYEPEYGRAIKKKERFRGKENNDGTISKKDIVPIAKDADVVDELDNAENMIKSLEKDRANDEILHESNPNH